MLSSSAVTEEGGSASDIREAAEECGLTLRRLNVWINEWRLRMRMMSICVEGAKGKYCDHPYNHIDILCCKMHMGER
jgi:hypothetical protein